jgi:hypothetical protein
LRDEIAIEADPGSLGPPASLAQVPGSVGGTV